MTGSATPRNYRQTILLLLVVVLSRIIKADIVDSGIVACPVHSRSALYWLHADKSPLPADAVRLAGTIVGELFGFVLSSHLSLHKTV